MADQVHTLTLPLEASRCMTLPLALTLPLSLIARQQDQEDALRALYLPYTSLYLPFISHVSPMYLPYISPNPSSSAPTRRSRSSSPLRAATAAARRRG